MRRVTRGGRGILFARFVLAGCGTSGAPIASPPTDSSSTTAVKPAPRLPAPVSEWFQKRFDASALEQATSADWVLTTHVKAEAVASGDIPGDNIAVYLFGVRGTSCGTIHAGQELRGRRV